MEQRVFTRIEDIDFRQLRMESNLTQKEVAEHLDTTIASISRIENGHSRPSPDNMVKMLNLFGYEMSYVLHAI